MAYIAAASTAFPAHYYSQEVLATTLKKYFVMGDLEFDLDVIDRFFTNVAIDGRFFMLPLDSFFDPPDVATGIQATIEATVDLVEIAVRKLLDKARLSPDEISQLTTTTLVAAVPSIDARLMNRIPFSPQLKRLPIGGVGCMGGAFGVARAADYLRGHPQEAAVVVAAEPSSALWLGSLQRDLTAMVSRLPENPGQYSDIIMTIITAALFGDGAGAVLLVGDEHPLAQPGYAQVIDTVSMWLPNTVDLMGMARVETGTRNILRPEVGEYARKGLRQAIDPLLAKHALTIEKIANWLVHPGGPKVINAVLEEFDLDDKTLQISRETLAKVGNISSPTVLYILDQILATEPTNAYGLMMAMGPGFSQEVLLLKW
ncbi:MAG: 3-oxoacyl-ACP synthase [Cyanobacteria bacterium J06635_1]